MDNDSGSSGPSEYNPESDLQMGQAARVPRVTRGPGYPDGPALSTERLRSVATQAASHVNHTPTRKDETMPDTITTAELIVKLDEANAEIKRLHKVIEGGNMLIMGCLERIGGEILLTPEYLERLCQTYFAVSTVTEKGSLIQLYTKGGPFDNAYNRAV